MTSMGLLRRRASLVRRMGSRLTTVIEEHDGDEEAVKKHVEEVYGNWVIWIQLAMQLLPILLELFKSLQERSKFRRMSQSVIADLSMQVMHDPETALNVAQDYELAGELERATFLRQWFAIHEAEGVVIVEEPQ